MTNERPERLGNVECSKCRHFNGGILSQKDGLTREQKSRLIKNIIFLCYKNPALLAGVVLDGSVYIDIKVQEVTIPDGHCHHYQPKLSHPNPPVTIGPGPDEYLGYAANLPEPYGF